MVNRTATLSFLTAVGASLCCVAPLLALFSGASGAASSLSWMEPARPYLMGLSVALLGFAWYKKLRVKNEACCAVPEKGSLIQSTSFLAVTTALVMVVLTYPLYAGVFYKKTIPLSTTYAAQSAGLKKVEFAVVGMSCATCEPAVEGAVAALPGVTYVKASCKKKNTVVSFDSSQTSIQNIATAINSTGYTVEGIKN